MSPDDPDPALVAAIEDFHRRRAMGEKPSPLEYRERLGALYEPFARLAETTEEIDRARAPAPETPLPRAFGVYVLERTLGVGGMGVVYEAFHRDLVRRVALKVLPRGLETDPSVVERFRREARACAQVHHPHVVSVFEAGEAEGRLFYAMELVAGRSLQAHIDARTLPEPRVLFGRMADVADALEALHHAGVVHRDVKPSNLIVRPEGSIVLADFGLARALYGAHLTQTGEALGTPPYMSPEQLLGRVRDVDARTDVYGLGATLYHALTGKPPFAAKEVGDLARMVLVQRPEALARRRPDLPPEFDVVVMKALEKRKEDRYVTAGAMRDDLRRIAAGLAPRAEPVSRWKRARRAARPYALPIAAALALLLGGLVWWRVEDSRRVEAEQARVAEQNARLASVVVQASPPLDVTIDGRPYGSTADDAVVARISPGEHELELSAPGFRPASQRFSIGPAERRDLTFHFELRGNDAGDPQAMAALAKALDVTIVRFARPEMSRARGDDEASPFLPRGDVRREDAAVLEVLVPRTASLDGVERVVFVERRDGTALVPPIPLDPLAAFPSVDGARDNDGSARFPVWKISLPPDVVASLRVGESVRWGVRSASTRRDDLSPSGSAATFTIVETDVSSALASLDEKLARQPDRLRSLFRALLLSEKKLTTAYARELLAKTPARERTLYEAAALYDALRRSGGLDDSGVTKGAYEDLLRHKDTDEYRRLFADE